MRTLIRRICMIPSSKQSLNLRICRKYFDQRLVEGIMPGFHKEYDIYIQNSTASLYNNYIITNKVLQLRFYQVSQIEKYISMASSNQDDLLTFKLLASSQSIVIERKLYSVVDIFAQIGGIKTSLMFAGLLFCAAFQQTLFQASLIRGLFHFPARFEGERKDLASKKKRLKDTLRNRDRASSILEDHNQYLESQDHLLTPNEIAEAI